jgi:acetylglutamate kinase
MITAEKCKHPSIDFGFVGDILPDGIRSKSIIQLLESDFILVFCAVTHNGKGQLLNTNADTMASALAVALSNDFEVSLVFCFEKNGVLADANDDSSLIPELSVSDYEALKQKGIVTKGMIPKLDNAFNARKLNVQNVMIGNASQLAQIISKQKDAATYILN